MLVTVDVGGSVAINTITKLGRQLASNAGKEETDRHLHASLPSPHHQVRGVEGVGV